MGAEDYMIFDLDREDDREYEQGYSSYYRQRNLFSTCKYCGEKGLMWAYGNGKWRLWPSHRMFPHNCSKYKR